MLLSTGPKKLDATKWCRHEKYPTQSKIDLFHSTAVYEDQAIALLAQAAQAANVRLRVLWDQRDANVWFCGPAGFGKALRQDLIALGWPAHRFHQELFAMC